jgi:hypothetical protein
MRFPSRWLIGLALICCAACLSPARAAEPAKPATPPSASPPFDPAAIVPELNVDNVRLEEVVDYLQDSVPGFKAVVVRDAGVSEGFPSIRIKLKRVAMSQFFQLLPVAYPSITMDEIPGPPNIIYCFRVHADPEAHKLNGAGSLESSSNVRVYPLADLALMLGKTRPIENAAAATKDGLNQILSLIKATLTQAGDSGPAPQLQVHEETMTLIFKGSALQRDAVESVLDALQGKRRVEDPAAQAFKSQRDDLAKTLAAEKDRNAERVAELSDEIEKLRKRVEERQDAFLKQVEESERLKIRLEEMKRQIEVRGKPDKVAPKE